MNILKITTSQPTGQFKEIEKAFYEHTHEISVNLDVDRIADLVVDKIIERLNNKKEI